MIEFLIIIINYHQLSPIIIIRGKEDQPLTSSTILSPCTILPPMTEMTIPLESIAQEYQQYLVGK